MKKILFISLFLFCFSSISHSQCQLRTAEETYEATCFKDMVSSESGLLSIISVAIAKNGNSGFFLMRHNMGEDLQYGKDVYLYLKDGTTIKLIDRDLEWTVNGKLFGQYILTSSEIDKLKYTNIEAVRYWTCNSIFVNCTSVRPLPTAKEVYNRDAKFSSGEINFPKLVRNLFSG